MRKTLIERSLYLLSILYDKDVSFIAGMPVGDRDAGLLKFRNDIFGSRLINVTTCPDCSTRIEWESDIKDFMLQAGHPDEKNRVLRLEKEDYTVDFRLPDSFDILEAMENQAVAEDPALFVSNCIISVRKDGEAVNAGSMPSEIITAVEQMMSDEDPQADIRMVLNCPECEKHWEAPFDIQSYLWLEIDNWAKRLLLEVSSLAKAFGWSEKEILGLSPQRRQRYIQMIS